MKSLTMRTWLKRAFVVFAHLVALPSMVGAVAGCNKRADAIATDAAAAMDASTGPTDWEKVAQAKLELSITAEDLVLEYVDNQVAAHMKYGHGKVIEVLGAAYKIEDDDGTTTVRISAPSLDRKDIKAVRCFVNLADAGQKQAVAGIRNYMPVKVRGLVTSINKLDDVLNLKGCIIDAASVGKDAAKTPTIEAPPRGSAEACKMLDACCPATPIPNAKGAQIACLGLKEEVRKPRSTMDCEGAVKKVLEMYRSFDKKTPPPGCK